MSKERWVEDKSVTCPKEDPAFAIPDGMYWIQDKETGKCSQGHMAGNPPPPPTEVPCPPSLEQPK